MSTPKKLLTTFDKVLLVGIVLGVLGICVLTVLFYFLWAGGPVKNSQQPGLTFEPFTTSQPNISAPDLSSTLTAGGVVTELPTAGVPSPVPGFSGNTPPIGRIVFTCFIKQIDQICIMNADGSDRKQITDLEGTTFYASMSPDGQAVYFSSRRNGKFDIYSVNPRGKDFKRLTKNIGSLYAPELSPNGGWIVFTNNGIGLWAMKPDGSNAHALTTADDIDPTWSPDGTMLAFASSRAGARQLFVMNADGSNVRQVTNLNDMGGRSTWSPDGTRLAFYAGPEADRNIYIINVDGTGLVQITNGGDNLGPSWSPDGNWIAYTSFRDGNNEIYIIHPDGTSPTNLTNSPISDWQPRWGR